MKYCRAIDSYISYCFEPHEVKTRKQFTDSIYWIKDGKIIVQIENSKYFWVHYDIWISISRMFDLNYSETEYIINKWLEQHPKSGELTVVAFFATTESLLEQHPKSGELTVQFAGAGRAWSWSKTLICRN